MLSIAPGCQPGIERYTQATSRREPQIMRSLATFGPGENGDTTADEADITSNGSRDVFLTRYELNGM